MKTNVKEWKLKFNNVQTRKNSQGKIIEIKDRLISKKKEKTKKNSINNPIKHVI